MCDVGSWPFAYIIQNEISPNGSKKTSVKEVTLQFSMIFKIRLKNNTVIFQVICPLIIAN
jgi:hypothetical protein